MSRLLVSIAVNTSGRLLWAQEQHAVKSVSIHCGMHIMTIEHRLVILIACHLVLGRVHQSNNMLVCAFFHMRFCIVYIITAQAMQHGVHLMLTQIFIDDFVKTAVRTFDAYVFVI